MNSYRIALILCRAVALTLWGIAGFRLFAGAIMLVATRLNVGGIQGVSGDPLSGAFFFPALPTVVPLVIGAMFLRFFSASLGASMTGRPALEGDAIDSRHALEPSESVLARAGAGLFLLFLGAADVVPSLLNVGQTILLGRPTAGVETAIVVFNMIGNVVPGALQTLVGFVLAFQLGLKRMMKPQS